VPTGFIVQRTLRVIRGEVMSPTASTRGPQSGENQSVKTKAVGPKRETASLIPPLALIAELKAHDFSNEGPIKVS